MDGGEIFIGLAVIAISALVTVAVRWKEYEGRRIVRNAQTRYYYEQVYNQTRRRRPRPPVGPQGHGGFGSWTIDCGNPVGYYGRILWTRFRRTL
jgi:hypothetical protein